MKKLMIVMVSLLLLSLGAPNAIFADATKTATTTATTDTAAGAAGAAGAGAAAVGLSTPVIVAGAVVAAVVAGVVINSLSDDKSGHGHGL